MKPNALLALALLLALSGPPAWAQDMEDAPPSPDESGDPGLLAGALLKACNPPAALDAAARAAADQVCQGYLRGLADGLFMRGIVERGDAPVCLPADGPVSPAEAKTEFQDYLADHPEAADHSAGIVATFALIAAHPCE